MSAEASRADGGERASAGRAVSAPANLLLLGEYAVLEEGGRGLALALDVRAVASLTGTAREGGRDRVVRGAIPGGEVVWPGDRGVLGGVADYLHERFGPAPGCVELDTSSFFRADGRKRGFGSSASLAVALTALWCGFDGTPADRDRVRRIATEAHRAAQGGRGSGYDTAVSALGGVVLFTGGADPQARRVELPWLPPITLFAGRDPVATTGAVGRYRAWRDANAGAADRFLNRSNELVDRFAAARSWEEARETLVAYRELTLELGDVVGVPARLEPSAPLDEDGVSKAVGAGDELGVVLAPGTAADRAVTLADEGVRWE